MEVESLFEDFPKSGEEMEIDGTYRLQHAKLVNIINEINSLNKEDDQKAAPILRQKGLQIYGRLTDPKTKGVTSIPFGMIVSGAHIDKYLSDICLLTLKLKNELATNMTKNYDILEVLRKYIFQTK